MGPMRSFLSGLLFLVALGTGAAQAAAAPGVDEAKSFIRGLADRTIATLADEQLSAAVREQRFAELFVEGFDVPTISRFVLGRHWRRASAEQRKAYLAAFNEFIIKTYTRRFSSFTGEQLEITGGREETKNDTVVLSRILRLNGPSTRVSWRVRQVRDQLKILDVIVEGVSMLITHRDEMNSVIRTRGGSVDGLIAALREKIVSYD